MIFSDLFTLCSDSDGSLDRHAFDQVVQDLLAVPSCLREAPSFGYSSAIASSCFTEVIKNYQLFTSRTTRIFQGKNSNSLFLIHILKFCKVN